MSCRAIASSATRSLLRSLARPASSRHVSTLHHHSRRQSPSRIRALSPSRYAPISTSSASTCSTLDSPPEDPSQQQQSIRVTVTPPSLEKVKQEGFLDEDVKLVIPEQAQLHFTPEAIRQLERITSREPPETIANGQLALRVGVESGGCHGYQYTMELTEERGVDDYVFQPEGVVSIPVVVDLVSLGLIKGSTLHHATELIGSSFRIQDNPQAKDGGACGCGISWEAKE